MNQKPKRAFDILMHFFWDQNEMYWIMPRRALLMSSLLISQCGIVFKNKTNKRTRNAQIISTYVGYEIHRITVDFQLQILFLKSSILKPMSYAES